MAATELVTTRVRLPEIEELVANLRRADVREIEASLGMEPFPALLFCVEHSVELHAVRVGDGPLLAIWGIGRRPSMDLPHSIWMLATGQIQRFPKATLRYFRREVAAALQRYGRLFNLVDARHEASVRWARHLGFDVHGAIPYGRNGELFHPIFAHERN